MTFSLGCNVRHDVRQVNRNIMERGAGLLYFHALISRNTKPGSAPPFRWDHEKNAELKAGRGISFEEIALAIEADGLCDVVQHPNSGKHHNQQVLMVALDGLGY